MTTREAYSVLESADFLRDLGEVQPITPEDMETRRRIIDFVHELDTARFMLAMSYKDPFLDLVEEKDQVEIFLEVVCQILIVLVLKALEVINQVICQVVSLKNNYKFGCVNIYVLI